MAPNGHLESRVIPAQLSFLSIYSPALGPTDETFRDQIAFYHSRAQKEARHASKKGTTPKVTDNELREEENERLRQIGLAQGMVGFAQSFSDGQNVDSVETEKSRIVLHELERGWWILASIDLTRLPTSPIASKGAADEDGVEYSAREVSPPTLLIEQLLTAHRIFLLHHGPSLQDLFEKIKRDRFCSIVERYWSSFCKDWEVLLHGNPAVDVFGGVKLAAGGELGMGVGEEEWGSGERAVLEDLTRETEGLVDLTVSRFGKSEYERHHEETEEQRTERENTGLPWLGLVRDPEAYDGLIFGGVGALSRYSLRDVSNWIAQIYSRGEHAYGVKDNPHRTRRKRPKRNLPSADSQATVSGAAGLRKQIHKPDLPNLPHDPRPALHERVASNDHAPGSPSIENPAPLEANMRSGIPRPIVSAVESSLDKASFSLDRASSGAQKAQPQTSNGDDADRSTFGISNDRWVKYLTFGLGGGKTSNDDASSKGRPNASRETSATSSKTLRQQDVDQRSRISKVDEEPQLQEMDPMPDGHEIEARLADQRRQETDGYFLIGLKKDLSKPPSVDSPVDEELDEDEGDRLLLRTLQVEIVKKQNYKEQVDNALGRRDSTSDSDEDTEVSSFRRLRVVVYVRRPFIYTFLFEQRTPALQMSAFYKDIHQHLQPLHKPLQSSTAIANIAQRIADSHTSPPEPPSINSTNPPYQAPRTSPVFDLVYDPRLLTIHTSIPNIPLPGTPAAEGISTTSSGRDGPPHWTRIEGLNVHSQILNTLDSTKRLENELERTSKTSRGWWVVWLRIPPFADDRDENGNKQFNATDCKIAFLVRRASDWYQSKGASSGMFSGSRVASGMFGLASKNETAGIGGSDATGWGPASLASGIGIDARKARQFNEQYNKVMDARNDAETYNSNLTMAGPSTGTSSRKREASDEHNTPKKAPRRQATRSKHEKVETFNLKHEAIIDLTGDDDASVFDAAKTPTKGKKSGKATQSSPKKGEEKRLKRYRAQAPLSMTAYHDRAANQRFFALNRDRTTNHDCPHGTPDCPMEVIDLAGSTGNVYQISIEHVPTCTCPNFTKGNAQCKHIIYVLNTVLKAPAHLSYQLAFLTSELREIFEHAGPLPIEKADQSDKDGKRKSIEDDCPICCCDLQEGDEEIVWCKAACGNNLHKSCFDRWKASRRGAQVTCPFCRTPWQKDSKGNLQDLVKTGKIGADGYVNVAQELGLSGQRDYSTYHDHWVRRQLGSGY